MADDRQMNPGLSGQLEDLALLDMLQIVAFSKKTGCLEIDSPFGRGGIVFREGLVVCAYSWSTLKYLRQISRQTEGRRSSEILQNYVEVSLRELAGLREGTFHFQVSDSVPSELGGMEITPFALYQGINPEALLLELAKGMDEERRETSLLFEAGSELKAVSADSPPGPMTAREVAPPLPRVPLPLFELPPIPVGSPEREPSAPCEPRPAPGPPPVPETAAEPETVLEPEAAVEPETAAQPEPPPKARPSEVPAPSPESETSVLLVDDELPVTRILGTSLRTSGYRVYAASGPLEAIGLASEIALCGGRLVVVTDLEMPTSNGRSFRGGFELVRMLQKNRIEAPIVLMTEKVSERARARAKELGVRSVALKPTLSKLDRQQYQRDLRAFAAGIRGLVERAIRSEAPREEPRPKTAGGEDHASAPFLEYIASMTRQLLDPRRSVEVSQMVLEVASKYLERGILFLVKGEMVSGLGGFGLASAAQESRKIARSISFNIQNARPFAEVVYSGKAERYSSEHEWLEANLYAAIGRARSGEFVLMPMLNHGEALVVLYGDNGLSGKGVGKVKGLELFIAQAGIVLENTFLHRKIRLFESKLARSTRPSVTCDVQER